MENLQTRLEKICNFLTTDRPAFKPSKIGIVLAGLGLGLLLFLMLGGVSDAFTTTTASRIYGQTGSFTSNTVDKGGISADSLNTSIGVTLDGNGGLYICDGNGNRVLHYPMGTTTADQVYGQAGSFSTNTANKGGVSADSLFGPTSLALDSQGGLYITDFYNSRVLHYPAGSTTADRVYGQGGDFSTNTANKGGVSANSLTLPEEIVLDSEGTLYVADRNNNRVLHYSGVSTTADRVYGQPNFNSSFNNTAVNADNLFSPVGLAVNNSGLYISDTGNHRVLHYPGVSTTANRVYGQGGSFNSNTANNGGISATSLYQPFGLALDGVDGLYVSDGYNNRILHYSGVSTTADRVYGQPNFNSGVENNGGISATTLANPFGIALDSGGGLYVADSRNNRVLYYGTTPPPTNINVSSGTGQSATINTAFGGPLVAMVRDANNAPVGNVAVTFVAPSSGPGGTFAGNSKVYLGSTDASGTVTTTVLTANSIAGSYTVTATVSGVTTPASFVLTNTTGSPTTITATAGTPQNTPINMPFGSTLVAKVTDAGNNPVGNRVITFTAPTTGPGGSFAGGTNVYSGTTDTSGTVTTTVFTANSITGSYTVRATVSGVTNSASFALTNTVGAAFAITTTAGTPQSTVINTPFSSTLTALVRDAGSNPISNTVVTFTAPSSGPGGTFAGGTTIYTGTTNTQGIVTSTVFTANALTGSYTVTATVGGVTTPASYDLTNLTDCNPNRLLVTRISDDGSGLTCETFSYALAQTDGSTPVTITFALTSGNTITFTGSLARPVPSRVTIDGGGLGIVLDGNGVSGDGLRLNGQDSLLNLTVQHFAGREIVAVGPGNRLRWVRTR